MLTTQAPIFSITQMTQQLEPCGLDATYNFSVSAGSSSSNYNWILEGVSSPLILNGNILQLTFGSDEVLEFVKN